MSRKIVYVWVGLLLFLFTPQVHGQNSQPAEFQNLNSLSKLEQVKALSKLCWQNREKQTDKAIAYGMQGIKIARAEGFNKELATLYNYVGVVYQHYKYDIQTAISYYNIGLPLSLQVNDSVEIAYVYNNLGDAFYAIGNVPLAFEYAQKSMKIFEKLNNTRGIAYSYINMGSLNRINEQYDLALDYFKKAIALRKTFNDSIGIASANLEVAQTLFLMGKTDEAMHYFRVSLADHTKIDNKNYMAYSMQGMGDVFLKRNELDSARIYFTNALELSRERHNPKGEIDSQLGIAKTLAARGKGKEGEQVLNRSMAIAQTSKLTPNMLKVYKAKGEFYHQLKEFRKASENYQQYISTYDSLFNVLQFQTLSEVKDRFQMVEQMNTINENLKDKQQKQIYALIIIVLLLGFAVILILRNRKITRLGLELRQSNEAKDKIFSIISHDLVSPFNLLIGVSELLMSDLKEKNLGNAEENGRLIQKTSEESYQLISNLLTWSRSQRKSIKLHREEFDLTGLAQMVQKIVSHQAAMKNIGFSIKAAQNIIVRADKNLLQIVLVNLVNNALKFTDTGGVVELSIEKENQGVKVRVKDNGVGMSPERLASLFKEKPLNSSPGTHSEKGTGLGLLLCKEFVEMHGGEIHANSQVSQGSEFWFNIPVS